MLWLRNLNQGGTSMMAGAWPCVVAVLSGLSGALATAAGLIPANCYVLGVTREVLTAISGSTGMDVGDPDHTIRWGENLPIMPLGQATDLKDFRISTIPLYGRATDVIVTARGGNFTGGSVRLIVYYTTLTLN
jgi:hypothetical protein